MLFFKKNIKQNKLRFGAFVLFTLFLCPFKDLRATAPQGAPYELEFADVVFQLNDATRFLLQQEMSVLQKKEDLLRSNLELLSTYIPEVEKTLKESAIPDDFKYMVIYNKFQSSTERSEHLASGVYWCMDTYKAQDVDLKMNDMLDERKNFFTCTDAAIISLKRNQVLYNNWGTTLFAHLASREVLGLINAPKKWQGKKYILLDSPAYSAVIQYLAFKLVLEQSFPAYRPDVQKIVYRYSYGAQKSLNVIAADLRVNAIELKQTNQWLKTDVVPVGENPVVVLVASSRYHDIRVLAEMSRNNKLSQVDVGFPVLIEKPSYSTGNGGRFFSINEKKGIQADLCDNAVTLAYKAGLPLKTFLEINELQKNDLIQIGRVYYLEHKNKKAPLPKHIAKEGETLWDIAQLYGVSLDKLLKYNRLPNVQRLQRGRVIALQKKRAKKETVEYIELPDESPLEGILLEDPILSQHSNFGEENRVIKEQTVESIEQKAVSEIISKEEPVVPLIDKELPLIKKEVIVSGLDPDRSYSENIKEIVLNEKPKKELPSDNSFVLHTVKKGETLYRISVNYKVSLEQLYKLNHLTSNVIEVGEQIKVKAL